MTLIYIIGHVHNLYTIANSFTYRLEQHTDSNFKWQGVKEYMEIKEINTSAAIKQSTLKESNEADYDIINDDKKQDVKMTINPAYGDSSTVSMTDNPAYTSSN